MLKGLSFVALMAVLAMVGVSASANEIITNGDMELPGGWNVMPTGWTGSAGTSGFDNDPVSGNYLHTGDVGQVVWQAIALTDNTRYTYSADVKAWGTDGRNDVATAIVSVAWSLDAVTFTPYAPSVISWTGGLGSDIDTWHHISTTFDIPAGTTFGQYGAYAIFYHTTNDQYYTAVRFDNVSLDARPTPEPATLALVAIGGGLTMLRRRRAA